MYTRRNASILEDILGEQSKHFNISHVIVLNIMVCRFTVKDKYNNNYGEIPREVKIRK